MPPPTTQQQDWVRHPALTGGQPSSSAPTAGQKYEAALKASNWQEAAEYLNGCSREDITKQLAKLKAAVVANIHQGALDNPRVGPNSNVAQMTDRSGSGSGGASAGASGPLSLSASVGAGGKNKPDDVKAVQA